MSEASPGMILYNGTYIKTPGKHDPTDTYFSSTTTLPGGYTITLKRIRFHLWLPTLLFGLWPAISLTRHIKRRYFSPGICRNCGYDLRGTPSGVCPECGRTSKIPQEASPKSVQ